MTISNESETAVVEMANKTAFVSNDATYLVAREKVTRLDRAFDSASEWFSSILVKESRQALKSRQFIWTFFFLLAIVGLWSFYALSLRQYGSTMLREDIGPLMFNGFLVILGFPLCIIIPFATFRSLAAEYEDGTIQMMLITTMKPYQIVAGKLGSALLQMMIYFSVLAPCISFCYLLRGVDVQQISFALTTALMVSVGLCCLGLALGSVVGSRFLNQVLSGLFALATIFVFWMWCLFFSYYSYSGTIGFLTGEAERVLLLGVYSIWLSTAALLFVGATAQISFPASNRSTPMRIVMFLQHTLFLGWFLAALCVLGAEDEVFLVSSTFSLHYWLLMGSMMVACDGKMSNRVRRGLPRTISTRSLFSLFMPGPGRGYLFAIANALFSICWMWLVLVFADISIRQFGTGAGGNWSKNVGTGVLGLLTMAMMVSFLYFLFFLSLSFVISRFINRRSKKPFVLLNLLITVLLLFLLPILCMIISPETWAGRGPSYGPTQAFNWFWTMAESYSTGLSPGLLGSLFIVSAVTIPLAAWSFFTAVKELRETPEEAPQRVLEEIEADRLAKEVKPDDETIDEIFAAPRQELE